jgi:hypothetical protein
MKLYFDDVAFDGQLQRSVGKADSGMATHGVTSIRAYLADLLRYTNAETVTDLCHGQGDRQGFNRPGQDSL